MRNFNLLKVNKKKNMRPGDLNYIKIGCMADHFYIHVIHRSKLTKQLQFELEILNLFNTAIFS